MPHIQSTATSSAHLSLVSQEKRTLLEAERELRVEMLHAARRTARVAALAVSRRAATVAPHVARATACKLPMACTAVRAASSAAASFPTIPETFAQDSFNYAAMKSYLDKDTYTALRSCIDNRKPVSAALADSFAQGLKRCVQSCASAVDAGELTCFTLSTAGRKTVVPPISRIGSSL